MARQIVEAKPPNSPITARIASTTPGHSKLDLAAKNPVVVAVPSATHVTMTMIENAPVIRPQRCISNAISSLLFTVLTSHSQWWSR